MLLTLSTPGDMAAQFAPSDLGYLLHKHPDKVFEFPLPQGQGQVFYPQLSAERCTAALRLIPNPVELSRGRPAGASGAPLEPYTTALTRLPVY